MGDHNQLQAGQQHGGDDKRRDLRAIDRNRRQPQLHEHSDDDGTGGECKLRWRRDVDADDDRGEDEHCKHRVIRKHRCGDAKSDAGQQRRGKRIENEQRAPVAPRHPVETQRGHHEAENRKAQAPFEREQTGGERQREHAHQRRCAHNGSGRDTVATGRPSPYFHSPPKVPSRLLQNAPSAATAPQCADYRIRRKGLLRWRTDVRSDRFGSSLHPCLTECSILPICTWIDRSPGSGVRAVCPRAGVRVYGKRCVPLAWPREIAGAMPCPSAGTCTSTNGRASTPSASWWRPSARGGRCGCSSLPAITTRCCPARCTAAPSGPTTCTSSPSPTSSPSRWTTASPSGGWGTASLPGRATRSRANPSRG